MAVNVNSLKSSENKKKDKPPMKILKRKANERTSAEHAKQMRKDILALINKCIKENGNLVIVIT